MIQSHAVIEHCIKIHKLIEFNAIKYFLFFSFSFFFYLLTKELVYAGEG
jgi:hypothetical protein